MQRSTVNKTDDGLLVTSQMALRVRAEQQFQVLPLTAPASGRLSPEEGERYAAVRLFVARARQARPDFQLDGDNMAAVADICRRLDGIPLALELAAARVALLPPAALLARLDRGAHGHTPLQLLTGGARDAPTRQRTLRAAIDWSYGLLTEDERTLLRRLAVFAGGCTLDAAEAVCPAAGLDEFTEWDGDVLEGLASLVDKSLLRSEQGAEPRFSMLETIRAYGLEQLAAVGETEASRRRHAAHYLVVAQRAEPALTGAEQGTWLARLEGEHDNLRAALQWSRDSGESALGLRLAGALWRFWYVRGHLSEGRAWLDGLLALTTSDREPDVAAIRAKALTGAGVLANIQGDYDRATVLCEESLTLYRRLDDTRGPAVALNILGNLAMNQGAYARAVALSEESLALYRTLGDKRGMAVALNNLGVVLLHQGAYERSAALCEESLTLNRELDDKRGISAALHNLGDVAREQGDYRQAVALYAESLALYRTMGDSEGIAGCLEAVARVAYAQGQMERATRFYAAAATLRDAIGASLTSTNRTTHDQALVNARITLGEPAFAAAWAAGAALSMDQADAEVAASV